MKTIAALIVLFTLAGFAVAANANPPAPPPGHAVAGHAAGMPADMGKADAPLNKKGKVLSSIATKGFTYIEVQDGSKKLWVVAPSIAVKNGSTISYADAPVQEKYRSASLNREFVNVLFATRVVVDK